MLLGSLGKGIMIVGKAQISKFTLLKEDYDRVSTRIIPLTLRVAMNFAAEVGDLPLRQNLPYFGKFASLWQH